MKGLRKKERNNLPESKQKAMPKEIKERKETKIRECKKEKDGKERI